MEGLLYRYLVRRTSRAEDREVYAWLEASEKNRSLFFEVAAVWSAHRTLISPATGERCDAMLRRLNARIDADDAMQRPARFAWRRWMSAAAAAAVVVIAVAAAWLAGLRLPEAGRFQSYANHTGDVAVLHLEDGTQVWLQDGTELRYAVGKGDRERIVAARRRGLFRRVSHDARHPFVVETRELAIRVLGTAFNVRALAGNPFTEVVLERGAVRLETPGGDNLVRLHPQPARRVRRPDGRHGGGRNQRAALCDQALQPGHDEGRHDLRRSSPASKELRRTHTHHVARRRQTLRHQLPAEQFAPGGRRHRRVHDRNALRGDPQRMIRGLRPTVAGLFAPHNPEHASEHLKYEEKFHPTSWNWYFFSC
ncbi:MAG: FecR family protein [Alistipes onderdonkii]